MLHFVAAPNSALLGEGALSAPPPRVRTGRKADQRSELIANAGTAYVHNDRIGGGAVSGLGAQLLHYQSGVWNVACTAPHNRSRSDRQILREQSTTAM